MRVWIENPYDNLPAEDYRPMRYTLMARAFAAAGHEVTLFTADFSHANKKARSLGSGIDEPFEIVFVHEPPYPRNVCFKRIYSHHVYATNWLRAARRMIAGGKGLDLLIVSIPPLSTVDAALAIRKASGCRLVFDIMDAWPETFERLLPRWAKGIGKLALLPMRRTADRAYRHADLVTGVCDRYGELVRGRGAKDYRRFYHGIEYDRVPSARSGLKLVYVGNLGRGYDLGTVIEAVKRIDGATLEIAGAGECEAKWRELASDEPRIRFHGYLGSTALSELLERSSIGVIPLTDDSFVGLPYKLGDYARNGLKCVSSLGGECAAMLESHSAGVTYRPHDVDSLVRAIIEVSALAPDFAGMLDELDSARIYREYAQSMTLRT